MRPRKRDRNLPPCVYLKHGAYWYVKAGKWTRLASDLGDALQVYAKLAAPRGGGMVDLIERAHPHIIKDVAENTRKQYDQARRALASILLEFSPRQVLPRDVAAIKTHYADRPNMGNRLLSYLRMVFALAVEWQEVDSNPCVGIKRHAEAKRSRYLNDAEFTAIRAAAGDSLLAVIDVAYLTGQRIMDVLRIRLDDITTDGIQFRQQKTKQRLLVSASPDLNDAIQRAKALPRKATSVYLFSTARSSTPYAYSTVRDMWNRAVSAAGIQDATLHDLRAKALTDAKRQGKNAVALGGHSDPRMTERYIRQRETTIAEPPSFRQPLDSIRQKHSK